MTKVNVSLDDDVCEELYRLVPARKRSRVINEALRKELLRRKRATTTDRLKRLREHTATFRGRDILLAVRNDRVRGS